MLLVQPPQVLRNGDYEQQALPKVRKRITSLYGPIPRRTVERERSRVLTMPSKPSIVFDAAISNAVDTYRPGKHRITDIPNVPVYNRQKGKIHRFSRRVVSAPLRLSQEDITIEQSYKRNAQPESFGDSPISPTIDSIIDEYLAVFPHTTISAESIAPSDVPDVWENDFGHTVKGSLSSSSCHDSLFDGASESFTLTDSSKISKNDSDLDTVNLAGKGARITNAPIQFRPVDFTKCKSPGSIPSTARTKTFTRPQSIPTRPQSIPTRPQSIPTRPQSIPMRPPQHTTRKPAGKLHVPQEKSHKHSLAQSQRPVHNPKETRNIVRGMAKENQIEYARPLDLGADYMTSRFMIPKDDMLRRKRDKALPQRPVSTVEACIFNHASNEFVREVNPTPAPQHKQWRMSGLKRILHGRRGDSSRVCSLPVMSSETKVIEGTQPAYIVRKIH